VPSVLPPQCPLCINPLPRFFSAHLWPLCASALSLGSCTTHYPPLTIHFPVQLYRNRHFGQLPSRTPAAIVDASKVEGPAINVARPSPHPGNATSSPSRRLRGMNLHIGASTLCLVQAAISSLYTPAPSANPGSLRSQNLSLAVSTDYALFVPLAKSNSFAIKQIQTLLPQCRGVWPHAKSPL